MSLEQVENLIEELGDKMPAGMVKPLRTEYEVKLLMQLLPTLKRPLSLALVTAQRDPSGSKRYCTLSDELASVFVHNRATESKLQSAFMMCSEAGQKVFTRARGKYEGTPDFQTVVLNAEELFEQVDSLEHDQEDQAQTTAEDFTADLPQDDAEWLRNYLRDTFGLESPQDWEYLKQARRCIAEQRRDLMNRPGRKTKRVLSKLAFDLYETAKANDCSPVAWLEWKKTKADVANGRINPLSIITVPGGRQIWGDGEPVRPDGNGQPRRKAIDIFGREVADNEQPDIQKIDEMVQKAYQPKQKQDSVNQKGNKKAR